jgi:alkanesulfonate monooxygenase SsuD/methylene tetrahydromethanopterin reductase-like flavin-dependent oxidoreductase (luciferase family)
MPLPVNRQYAPPQSWEEFESLCADIYERVWKDPNTQKHGRQGQPQGGVDVYGRPDGKNYSGVQCKNKSVWPPRTLTEKDVDEEVKKAKTWEPGLKHFIVATTAPNDDKVQAHARKLTEAHKKKGFFSVTIVSWDEITRRLSGHRDLLGKYGYAPFHIDFKDNQSIFEEGMEVIQKLWAADDRISHHGKHYSFDDVRITPKPIQKPLPAYVGSFSKPSIELAARLGYGLIVAPFAAAMSYGGLKQVADLYNETCIKHGRKPGRLMCSYFTHFYDNKAQEDAARARQIRYYKECVIPALPGDPKTAPPSYTYFIDMVKRLHRVQPEQLTENSVLLGNSQSMIDTLKKVEAAGFSEVILYFNVGMKPHQMVKEEMDRFMREVAPHFQGKHHERRP